MSMIQGFQLAVEMHNDTNHHSYYPKFFLSPGLITTGLSSISGYHLADIEMTGWLKKQVPGVRKLGCSCDSDTNS